MTNKTPAEHVHELANHMMVLEGNLKRLISITEARPHHEANELQCLQKLSEYLGKSVRSLQELRASLKESAGN